MVDADTNKTGVDASINRGQAKTSKPDADAPSLSSPSPSKVRTGTVTLEGLQKELGDKDGRAEYLSLGESFGITALNINEFHPPLDLDSITTKE